MTHDRWKRKTDGVIVTARERRPGEGSQDHVCVQREDTGRHFWTTWGGLTRKYAPAPADQEGDQP